MPSAVGRGELTLTWTPGHVFLSGGCWQPSPWEGWAWRWRCLSWSWVQGGTFRLLSCCHRLNRGRSWSDITGAEALKVRPKLALFAFKCVFSSAHTGTPQLQSAEASGAWASSWPVSAADRHLSLVSCPCRQLRLCPSLCSAAAWVQVPFIPHGDHHPLPLQPYCEASSHDRRGPHRLPACLRSWAVQSSHCRRSGLLRSCLTKGQQRPPPPHPGSALGPNCSCIRLSFPRSWPSQHGATVWQRVSGAGAFAWLGLGLLAEVGTGDTATLEQTSLHPAGRQASTPVLLTSRLQAPHTPPISLRGPPTTQGGSSLLHRTPGLGCPICGSHHSLPIAMLNNIYSFNWLLSSLSGKESTCNSGETGSIPGQEDSPGGGDSNPLQCSCLGNPVDRGARWATVHGVAKSWTWLSD